MMNNTRRLTVGQKITAKSERLTADRRFGRYTPESSHNVRQPDITGQSFSEQVKRTREMLREMTPGQALEVIEFHRGLTIFEALALAKREGRLIVPNNVHDKILTETRDEECLIQIYPLWSGTLVIYEAPDKKFDKKVVYGRVDKNNVKSSIFFNVPKQFRGLRNCALVVEHPDFDLIDLGNNKYELKITDEKVHQIQDFPKSDGWYMPNTETGIPHGGEVEQSSNSRYLWRIVNGSYLGPLIRGVGGRCNVVAVSGHDSAFGVALVPLAVAPKKSDSHD